MASKNTWTKRQIKFLKDNYSKMSNRQLSDQLGICLTYTRMKLYELGLKRMELEYWTLEQVQYLKKNYRRMGDVELAEYFQANFPKKKGWTKKHIEKKRKYLKLNRTSKEQDKIKKRNTKQGRFSINHYKRWLGKSLPVGSVLTWNLNGYQIPFIKFRENAGWKNYMKLSHYNWIKANGRIPKGYLVIHKDGNPMNCDTSNLDCISRADHGKRSIEYDNRIAAYLSYGNMDLREELIRHPEILELYRLNLKLRRSINNVNAK